MKQKCKSKSSWNTHIYLLIYTWTVKKKAEVKYFLYRINKNCRKMKKQKSS